MSSIKLAIIGAGHVAQTNHIPNYRSYRQPVEIVGICGRDPERTAEVAKRFGIGESFTQVDTMLQACQPDVVSVCTPNATHAHHVLKALEAGCHVLCEKPPAVTYNEAQLMAAKAKEANRLLAYNFQNRQLKELEVLKQYHDEKGFGELYHIKASFLRRRGIPGWGSFTNKEIQGGGALMDLGVHILDLALHFLNYPKLKTALASTYNHIGTSSGVGLMGSWIAENFSVEDACFAQLNFENNLSITLEAAFALNTQQDRYFNLEIFGSKAGATLLPLKIYTEKANQLADINFPFLSQVNPKEKNIHRFLDACFGAETNICTADEGVLLQGIIEALYQSAESGKAISLG